MRPLPTLLLSLFLVLPLAACEHTHLYPPSTPLAERWTETQLFFGLSKQDGSLLTNQEWDAFADELTKSFPDGLTILSSDGLYLETRATPPQPRREPSRIVILCYPASDSTAEPRIQAAVQRYCTQFKQLNVLRLDAPVRGRLIAPVPAATH